MVEPLCRAITRVLHVPGYSELDRHMDGHGSGDNSLKERNRTPKFPDPDPDPG